MTKPNLKQLVEKIDTFTGLRREQVHELQRVLESELKRPVSEEEAASTGESLLRVYEHLAGNDLIKKGGLKNKQLWQEDSG